MREWKRGNEKTMEMKRERNERRSVQIIEKGERKEEFGECKLKICKMVK